MSDDSEIERTLCQLPQAHVFRIPARKNAEGHRAADWPKDPLWTGRVKIVAKGRTAIISLIDAENKVFAACPVTDETAVERCLDSGRYFVLRIVNPAGKHAFIGLAFNERNDAFDFNVALSEHKAECEREDTAATGGGALVSPLRDLRMKDGEKITIKIGDGVKKEKKPTTASPSGGFKLAPPPGSKGGLLAPPPADATTGGYSTARPSLPVPASSSSAAHSAASLLDDFGSSFGSSSSAATTVSSDPFAAFASPAPVAPTTVFSSWSSAPAASPAASSGSSTAGFDDFGFPTLTSATSPASAPATSSGNLLDF